MQLLPIVDPTGGPIYKVQIDRLNHILLIALDGEAGEIAPQSMSSPRGGPCNWLCFQLLFTPKRIYTAHIYLVFSVFLHIIVLYNVNYT